MVLPADDPITPVVTPNLDPVKPPTAPERTKEQKKASFRYILRYAKTESCLFFFGVVFLLLSSAGTFVVPLYIGLVIDLLADGNFDKVGPTCLQFFIIVSVSKF